VLTIRWAGNAAIDAAINGGQDPHEAVPDDQYGDDREHNRNGLGIGEGSQQLRKIRPGGVSFDAEFSTFIQE
jgi:hypothetical protein